MQNSKVEQEQVDQGVDVQETLRFIDRVMSHTRKLTHSNGLVPLTWGILTAVAIVVTWLLSVSGKGSFLSINAVWVVHNIIGWTVTITHIQRSGTVSKFDRQLCAVWAVMTLAIWILIASAILTGIPAGWAILTMVQFVAGIGLAMTGIIVGVRSIIFAGAVLVLTFPAIR